MSEKLLALKASQLSSSSGAAAKARARRAGARQRPHTTSKCAWTARCSASGRQRCPACFPRAGAWTQLATLNENLGRLAGDLGKVINIYINTFTTQVRRPVLLGVNFGSVRRDFLYFNGPTHTPQPQKKTLPPMPMVGRTHKEVKSHAIFASFLGRQCRFMKKPCPSCNAQ